MERSTVFATFKHCKNAEFFYQRLQSAFNLTRAADILTRPLFKFFCCRHLGRNPFLCDCYLTWLADYLHRKPVETSGVRCESPRRMQRRRIAILRDEKSRCSGKLDGFSCHCEHFIPHDIKMEIGSHNFQIATWSAICWKSVRAKMILPARPSALARALSSTVPAKG